jgi:hypothetical protein
VSDEQVTIDCSLAANMVGQLASVFASGHLPRLPPPGHMRGVDFYTASQLVHVLAFSAQLFRDRHGYLPQLGSPNSFTEHVFARKFLAALPIPSLADKLVGREYARARVGDELITPIVWTGDQPADLLRASVPSGRFMLKANHGSGFNMAINLPDDLKARRSEIESTSARWLATPFGFYLGEWQYCTFRPKLFLEEYVPFNGSAAPDEYNVLCFRGEARLIIRVAEVISRGFDFVRIDVVSDGRRSIRFGEITFTPTNAMRRFSDFQFDLDLGKHFLG